MYRLAEHANEQTRKMSDLKIVAGIWEPKTGKSVRICSIYQDKIHALIWISIGIDGSIYLGRPGAISSLKVGESLISNGSFIVSRDEGTEISDSSFLKNAKISFHSSGCIKLNISEEGLRYFRRSFVNPCKYDLVCTVLFQHPSAYKYIEITRKQDIVLNYPFDEECPLLCRIYVSPIGCSNFPLVKDASYQMPLILQYRNLKTIYDLTIFDMEISLIFFHKSGGLWPPYSYFLWC